MLSFVIKKFVLVWIPYKLFSEGNLLKFLWICFWVNLRCVYVKHFPSTYLFSQHKMDGTHVQYMVGWFTKHLQTTEKEENCPRTKINIHIISYTHTSLTVLFPGVTGWASTRKEKPIWILLKQETVSGSGISWAICKSAPRCRQMTIPAPPPLTFLQAGCLPAVQPTASTRWRHRYIKLT